MLFATKKDPNFESKTRLGYEGQLRYTFGRFSLGAGYQRSTVFAFNNNALSLALSLAFVEPRVVLAAGGGVAAYLAGRVGVGKLVCSQSGQCNTGGTNASYGGGGGLLFRLSPRLAGDLGVQYFQVNGTLSSGYAMVRAGLGVGL
jgi:opacity protein-like surface antigen